MLIPITGLRSVVVFVTIVSTTQQDAFVKPVGSTIIDQVEKL